MTLKTGVIFDLQLSSRIISLPLRTIYSRPYSISIQKKPFNMQLASFNNNTIQEKKSR